MAPGWYLRRLALGIAWRWAWLSFSPAIWLYISLLATKAIWARSCRVDRVGYGSYNVEISWYSPEKRAEYTSPFGQSVWFTTSTDKESAKCFSTSGWEIMIFLNVFRRVSRYSSTIPRLKCAFTPILFTFELATWVKWMNFGPSCDPWSVRIRWGRSVYTLA